MCLRTRFAATLVALTLVAAGCSANVSANLGTTEPTTSTAVATTSTTLAGTPAGSTTTTTQALAVVPEAKVPIYGGTLRYGIEADSFNPWTPQNTAPAISGHMVLRSVFDTLALPTVGLEVKGNLLESIEHNDDFTVWTLRVRPGIVFHDGTPLDGPAVAVNLQRHRSSFIGSNILSDVAEVDFDEMSVTVTMRRPWTSFPVTLTGQVGYVASPSWLAEVDTEPSAALRPVGTGPFVFESYTPGVSFTAVRNDSYWREGLPYLNKVEFRIYPGIAQRTAALESGAVDIIHTANGDTVGTYRAKLGAFNMVESVEFGETYYVLLNVGNPGSPVSDQRVRHAMALALDYELIKIARNGGIMEVPNGPFQPGSPGYLADTGFPTYDPDEARRLVDEYEADIGPIEITYTTTTDEFNLITAELLQQFWRAVGIDVTLATIDQAQYVGFALVGNFEAYFWRMHSGWDPDDQLVFWSSANARNFGEVGTNFNRMADTVIDEQLATIRTSADQAARTAAAEEINRRFAEEVYSIWLGWAVWGIISHPSVQQVNTGFTLPDGDPVLATGVGIGGTHQLAQMWIDPEAGR